MEEEAQEYAYWAKEEFNREMYNGTWNLWAEFYDDGLSDSYADSDAWKAASP